MVGLDGEKMSKSRGNLVLVSALRRGGRRPDGDPPGAARPPLPHAWDWTDEVLAQAQERLAPWRRRDVASTPDRPREATMAAGARGVADDLDTPGALAAVDRWARESLDRGGDEIGAPAPRPRTVDALLGVRL